MTPSGERLERWEGESREFWCRAWNLPELVLYRRIGSTNDALRAWAEEGAPAGSVVLADEQTAGRGRRGRSWNAPGGTALLLSVLFRWEVAGVGERMSSPGANPVAIGLAVARAVERVAGCTVSLKWPNDILSARGEKLGGILCEGSRTPQGGFLVVGIGINVAQTDGQLANLDFPAASLSSLTGRTLSRPTLAAALLDELRPHFQDAFTSLDEVALAEYRGRDALYGAAVVVDGQYAGRAAGVDAEGGLRVRLGEKQTVLRTGTVRPAWCRAPAWAQAARAARENHSEG